MSQFDFLQREWPELFDAARRAEAFVHNDPRPSCFYARRTLELTETDLSELERILIESGAGDPEDIARAKVESQGLGLFVRGLVVNHLTEHSSMQAN